MRKVLFIGWDAADWKVIHALIEKGRMPHTAALIERGVMGDLATLQPVLSPMLWTSIATGKRPYKHGILGFTEPTPDGSAVQPISQLGRKTKAVWNILNQGGLRPHVIAWWPSHPVEKLNGVMVSNHFATAVGPPDQPWPVAPRMIHPPRLVKTLAELRLNPNDLLLEQVAAFVPKAAEIDQDKDRRVAMVMKTLAECATVHAAATYALSAEPWDFAAVYYDSIDHFCHGFMRYHPPRLENVSEEDFELYRHVVEAAYVFHDMMLGTMLDMVPEDTTVILCSDHGFHPDELRPVQLPDEPAAPAIEHRDLGMFIMAGPGIKRDALIHGASLLDLAPTILTLFDLPIGEDMDGKVLGDAFEEPPAPASIPSWDLVEGDDARLPAEEQYDPFSSKEAMDQLVALGYIEAPDENREKAVRDTIRELRYNLARSYMDGGRHVEAAPILHELYEAEPNQYRFGIQLCLCYRALGRATELRPLVARLTGDRREAAVKARTELATLLEEIKERQREAGLIAKDGELDTRQLEDDERRRYRKLALLGNFNAFDLDYLMGWVLIAEDKSDEALPHLRRAAEANPRRIALRIHVGEALLALQRWTEAEDAFTTAIEIDPLNPHANLGKARALLRQRRTEESIRCALRSVSSLYHNPMAHFVLGLGLWRLGERARAAEAMEVAAGINPNFERAHRFLARYATIVEWNPDKSRERWKLVREIRAERQRKGIARAAETRVMLEEIERDETEDVPRETRPVFDAAPEVPAGTKRVPACWKDCVTVVTGLPRSGTSMMMQMLAAGGISTLTDGRRQADPDNVKGYFELEAATRLRDDPDKAWLDEAGGKAVKIVAQLLPHLAPGHAYRIVFMERELDEVLASQKTMLQRLGRAEARLNDRELKTAFERQLQQVRAWLARQPNIEVHFVSHQEALRKPDAVAASVATFLGGELDQAAMAGAVDASLYRHRAGSSG